MAANSAPFDPFAEESAPFDPFAVDAPTQSPGESGGFVASAKQSIGSGIKGAGQAAADFLPGISQDNALKRYGQEVIDANPTAIHSLGDIAEHPLTALKEATGNAGASMAGVVGARLLGQGITAASPLAGPAAPLVAGIGQGISWLGPVAAAALPSFGGIREQQIQADPSNQDSLVAKAAAAAGAATVGAIESKIGPEAWAQGLLTKAGRDKLAETFAGKSLLGSIGKGIVRGAAVEGAEEMAQNPVEQLAAFQSPLTPENIQDTMFSGAMGALGGAGPGGAFGLAGRQAGKASAPPPTAEQPGQVPPAEIPPNSPATPEQSSAVPDIPAVQPALPDTGPLSRAANLAIGQSNAQSQAGLVFPFGSPEAAATHLARRQDAAAYEVGPHPTVDGRFGILPAGTNAQRIASMAPEDRIAEISQAANDRELTPGEEAELQTLFSQIATPKQATVAETPTQVAPAVEPVAEAPTAEPVTQSHALPAIEPAAAPVVQPTSGPDYSTRTIAQLEQIAQRSPSPAKREAATAELAKRSASATVTALNDANSVNPPTEPTQPELIFAKNGKPFKGKGSARMQASKHPGYAPVQVAGGWALQRTGAPHEATQSLRHAPVAESPVQPPTETRDAQAKVGDAQTIPQGKTPAVAAGVPVESQTVEQPAPVAETVPAAAQKGDITQEPRDDTAGEQHNALIYRYNPLVREYQSANEERRSELRPILDGIKAELDRIGPAAMREAAEQSKVSAAKEKQRRTAEAQAKFEPMSIGTRIGISGHEGNEGVYWEKTDSNQWTRHGIGSQNPTKADAEMEGGRVIDTPPSQSQPKTDTTPEAPQDNGSATPVENAPMSRAKFSKSATASDKLSAEMARWSDIVEQYLTRKLDPTKTYTLLTSTPASMQALGLPDLEVRTGPHMMGYANIRLSREQMDSLPIELANPKAVYIHDGNNGLSINFVTSNERNGERLVIALKPNQHIGESNNAHFVATVINVRETRIVSEFRNGHGMYVESKDALDGLRDAVDFAQKKNGRTASELREQMSRNYNLTSLMKRLAYKSDLVNAINSGKAQYSTASQPIAHPHTQSTLTEALSKLFWGKWLTRLLRTGKVEIIDSQRAEELLRGEVGPAAPRTTPGGGVAHTSKTFGGQPNDNVSKGKPDIKYSKDGVPLAFYLNGKTYFIADHLSQDMSRDELMGLARHEIGVHALNMGRNESGFQSILKNLQVMRGMGNQQVQEAYRRAVEAGAPEPLLLEETLGYLTESAPQMSVVRRFLAWFKEAVYKLTGLRMKLTPDDLSAMAQSALRRAPERLGEANAEGSDIRYSKAPLTQRLADLAHGTTNQIVGNSGRSYDQSQRAFFKNVGRDIDQKTRIAKTVEYLQNDFWKKMAVGIVDQFRGLRDLGDNGQAYLLARLSKGTAGAFDALLHHGKLSIRDGVYDADRSGGFVDRLGKTLHGELDDFLWHEAANRAEGLSKVDRENLFTPADIAAGKSLANGTTNFDYTIQTGPAKGTVTRNRQQIYADAHRVFREFQKNALDIAEQSGLINGESRKHWESEFYVPFYRVSEEDGEFIGAKMGSALVRQQAFKKLKGGSDKLNSDLLSNTLLNWSHLIDASAKNRAAKAALDAADKSGAAQRVASTMAEYSSANGTMLPPGTKGTVWYQDNGQKIEYKVTDPFVLTAITSLEYAGMRNKVMNVLTKFKHFLTVGVTASPAFKVRNLIRDSIQAIGTSDLGYNVVGNLKQGIAATNRDSQDYVSALASGGLIRFGTMLEGKESDRVRQLIKSGVKDSSILNNEGKVQQFYDKFLEPAISAYNELGNRGEEINRAALYKQLIAQGKSHAEAALLARDLMDFSMQGSFATIRFLTQVVPFLNARLQGLYKLGRAAKDDPRKLAIVTGAVALAGIGLMMAYHDDDDWKKREDWDLNNYWWFKIGGETFRIPKPFEVGAVGSLAERTLQLLLDDEMTGKRFAKNLQALLQDNLAMNPTPQLIKPLIDLYANKDSFTGRPIETMGMEKLDPQHRYTSNTSLPSRGLSTATNGVLSPVQYDHLIRGYFSWLGAFVVGGADMAARAIADEPTKPTMDYWKFATQGFVQDTESAGSRYVSQMYDQAQVLEQAYGTWHQLLKDGKLDEANAYREDHKDELNRYKSIEHAKKAESLANQQIHRVENSTTLSADEKRDRINEIKARKDMIARRVAPGYQPTPQQ